MLREEGLDPATIGRLAVQYKADNNWGYKRSQRHERLIAIHSGTRVFAKHKDGLSQEAPKPRTFDICKWKGADPEGKFNAKIPFTNNTAFLLCFMQETYLHVTTL
jgi:hypothetical protein